MSQCPKHDSFDSFTTCPRCCETILVFDKNGSPIQAYLDRILVLKNEAASLRKIAESYRDILATLVEYIDRGWDHNIPVKEARAALENK